jgi:hypothetical protein
VAPDRGARAGWLDRTPLCFRTLASRVAVSPSESDDETSSFAVLENELENESEKFEIHSPAPFFAFDDRICKYDCVLLILSTKDPVENAKGSDSRLQDAYKISLTGESHGLTTTGHAGRGHLHQRCRSIRRSALPFQSNSCKEKRRQRQRSYKRPYLHMQPCTRVREIPANIFAACCESARLSCLSDRAHVAVPSNRFALPR